MPVQSLCLRRWGFLEPSSAQHLLQDVRRVERPFTFFSDLDCHPMVARVILGPWLTQSVYSSYDANAVVPAVTCTLDHFSRHNLLDLQNDCLLTCVHGTTTLCLHDMSMLAFTAAELKVVQSLVVQSIAIS